MTPSFHRSISWMHWIALVVLLHAEMTVSGGNNFSATATSSTEGFSPEGAVDGARFSIKAGSAWRGAAGPTHWFWQVEFPAPRAVGGILQILGDHEFILRNAPKSYAWQGSRDGIKWFDFKETLTQNESRLFRLHRLRKNYQVRFMRLRIESVIGTHPVLREVEFLSGNRDAIQFPDWIIAVNTTHDPKLPNHGQEFIPLAKSCAGWEQLQAQQAWLNSFDETFLSAEPQPLCAFLSVNFKDWCEVEREHWRGVQDVLRKKNLPIWASCGGAQGLAILAEAGVDKPWDCPHCRNPLRPKIPIYTHVGHAAQRPCGDYSGCVFERGPHWIMQVGLDPVFAGLSREAQFMESHCGQIEWPPKGWKLIATAGQGTTTRTQCLRLRDRYVYAAQFHIEMAGTPEASRLVMGNFLNLARSWGGYNPKGKSVSR